MNMEAAGRQSKQESETDALFPDRLHRVYYFSRMIYASARIGSWCFDLEGTVRGQFSDELETFLTFLRLGGCLDYAIQNRKKMKGPVILTDALDMVWIAEFEPEKELIFMLGPVFSDSSSVHRVEQAFYRLYASPGLFEPLKAAMQHVPILSHPNIIQYVSMLHFVLFNQELAVQDISYQGMEQTVGNRDKPDLALSVGNHEEMLAMENAILQVVRSGNVHGRAIVEQAMKRVTFSATGTGDPLRDGKNQMLVFANQCARAAIEGGLSPKISLAMNAYYGDQIERCRHTADLQNVNNMMLADFTEQVRLCKEHPQYSNAVQECCAYIQTHLREEFSLVDLAHVTGFTEYYLSRKFARETGMHLYDYIRRARISEAKNLLLTNRSVDQIAEELCFNNRSYFCRIFKEITGQTPSQYRQSFYTKGGDQHETEK